MTKATILDRLTGAMKTLGKREGKALTPRQRVAAAQRWNSLAGIGEGELDRLYDLSARTDRAGEIAASKYATLDYDMRDFGFKDRNSENRAGNPFLSEDPAKYAEQSDFLDWCRYNRVEPNGQALKQFRWETYKTLPYRERRWIANKDAVRNYMRDNYTLYGQQPPELKTLRDVDEYWTENVWNGVEPREGYLEYAYPKRQPYSSIEEFPDDFDYMWRY